MSSPVHIRRARRADASAVQALWVKLLDEMSELDPRFRPSEDAEARWANDFPLWLRDDTRRLFVADADGEVVGFASAQKWWAPPVYAESAEVYVDEVYVAPGRRGTGVGRELVDAVRAWAEELGAVGLRAGILAANEAGRRFWEEAGGRALSITYTLDLGGPGRRESASKARKLGF